MILIYFLKQELITDDFHQFTAHRVWRFLVTLPIGANGAYVFYTLPPRLKQRREFIILASDFP